MNKRTLIILGSALILLSTLYTVQKYLDVQEVEKEHKSELESLKTALIKKSKECDSLKLQIDIFDSEIRAGKYYTDTLTIEHADSIFLELIK